MSNWEVSYDGLSNYAVQRIFEMGYDPEVFSDFDSNQASGRGSAISRYEVFSREYYWSPASRFFEFRSYYGGDAMPTALSDPESDKQIALAYNTALHFLWEEEYDCSKEEIISYFKPTLFLSLGLKPALKEGQYLNHQNEIVVFDPSVYEKGPACLLIRKDYLQKFLKGSGRKLVWIVQGEKQILGNHHDRLPDFDHLVSGLYHMDSKGQVDGDMKTYVRDYDYDNEK